MAYILEQPRLSVRRGGFEASDGNEDELADEGEVSEELDALGQHVLDDGGDVGDDDGQWVVTRLGGRALQGAIEATLSEFEGPGRG